MEEYGPLREALDGVKVIQEEINESLQHVLDKLSTVDMDTFREEIHSILDDINVTELAVEHRLLALEKGQHLQDDYTMVSIIAMCIWGCIVYYVSTAACGVGYA